MTIRITTHIQCERRPGTTDLETCDQCCGTGWMHPDDPAGRCEKCQGRGGIYKTTAGGRVEDLKPGDLK